MSEIEDLRRKAAADPGDAGALQALFRARFRVEGSAAALELLRDVPTWEAAGEELQDLAVAEVGRLLGPSYQNLGARWFESDHPQGEWKQNENGRRYFKRRVGVFRHERGFEMALIPGAPGIAPFLMAREALRIKDVGELYEDPRFALIEALPRVEDAVLAAILDGLGLRLPTMAEWLHACAGGVDPALYSWDDPPEDSFFRHWDSGPHTPPISFGVQNPFGLIGMIGENWEQVVNAEGEPSFCGGSPRALGRIRIRPRHWTLDGYLPDGLSRCYRPARSLVAAR